MHPKILVASPSSLSPKKAKTKEGGRKKKKKKGRPQRNPPLPQISALRLLRLLPLGRAEEAGDPIQSHLVRQRKCHFHTRRSPAAAGGEAARVPKEHPLFLLLFIPVGSASAAGSAAPSRAPGRRGSGHRRGDSLSAGFFTEFPGAPHQNRRRGPRSPVQPPPPAAAAAQAHSKENNT